MDPPGLTDLPLELVRQIAGADRAVYHPLVLAYPAFARSLTLGDRLDYAEAFGYDCRVEYASGYSKIVWCRNNVVHRTDGPAKICDDGSLFWYVNGCKHRMDGPAWINNLSGCCTHSCISEYMRNPEYIVCENIHIIYYINERAYSEYEYYKKVAQIRGQ